MKERRIIISLSPRLKTIATMLQKGKNIIDVGTDHAYLPVYLIKKQLANYCIAGDINQGPYESAKAHVTHSGLDKHIQVRLGNGLLVVQPKEVQVAIMAGMGSSTIIDILEGSQEVVQQLEQLILQPMVGARQLRQWLAAHNWMIDDEKLVLDDHLLYVVMSVTQGEVKQSLSYIEEELGPILIEKRPMYFKEYAYKIIQDYQKAIDGLAKAKGREAIFKKEDYEQRVHLLERVLHED
jgi:tRNA (adenine22-N1)-methyltransferase